MLEKFETFEIENAQIIYGGFVKGRHCNMTGEWIPDED